MIDFQKIKNFIFDFGGVLYEIDHQRTLIAFSLLSSHPESFTQEKIAQFSSSPALIDIETGNIEPDEFRKRIKESMFLTGDDEKIDDAWNRTLIGLYPDSVEILSGFKHFGNLVLMSNTNEIHYKYFEPQCRDLFSIFEREYYSHIVGMRKPDSKFFSFVLNEMQFKPEETIFIDDTIDNILAAEKLKINTYHINKGNTLSDLLHSVANN